MDSQLGLEILKAVKPVGGIELFVILAVAALDFAIVPGCIWADEFVTDAKTLKFPFKERRLVASFWKQAVGKFGAVVGLDTFNGKGESFDHVTQENGGRIGAVLLKRLDVTKSTVLIQKGILIPLGGLLLANNTGSRHEFHVDLHPLSGILHLFIGFRYIFGVWQLDGHSSSFAQEPVQPGDGSGVAPLPQFHPEHHDPGVWISASHVQDQLDLFRCMLVGMAVRAMGTVCQGLEGAVVPFAPAVDILPVQVVADRGFCDTMLVGILNYGLPKAHCLCYLIHGE